MMLRSISTALLIAGLAISAVAQQRQAAAPQDMRQEAQAVTTKYAEAVNKGDAKEASSLFSANGLSITPYGVSNSREKMEQTTQMVHKLGIHLTMNVEEVQPGFGGQGALANGAYSATYTNNPATPKVEGNFLQVFEREGDAWKIRALTFTRLAPPSAATATGTMGTQPTTGTTTPPAPGATTK